MRFWVKAKVFVTVWVGTWFKVLFWFRETIGVGTKIKVGQNESEHVTFKTCSFKQRP